MPPKKSTPAVPRTVALCYIRQSFTRDANDMNSPERQRANIESLCSRMGWTPEWYQDAEGHKSGRYENNRPEWLRLKARLADPEIAALVANDLSRLHRKMWRIGKLVEELDEYGVRLMQAAPGREIDTSTPMGRMFIAFIAMQDEAYAADISAKTKESVLHRKSQGKSIGRTPFGTIRNEEGYLQPLDGGAWLLPDGTFAEGDASTPPQEGAIWRSYFEAAERILRMYATGLYGMEKIAYRMQREGWAFRDRKGKPRPMKRDDVRRVVCNWPEYGGLVFDGSAKSRSTADIEDPKTIVFDDQHAVFDLDLLRAVAAARKQRTVAPVDNKVKLNAYPYPLTVITYCSHCEARAKQQGDLRLRTTLTGWSGKNGFKRYRHDEGVNCGVQRRTVHADVYEEDFARLIDLLALNEETQAQLYELARSLDESAEYVSAEREKQEAIALSRRRLEAAVNLYSDGVINREEYLRRKEENERQIAEWEARFTEPRQILFELTTALNFVNEMPRLWKTGSAENRQILARTLFEYLVYDLDSLRITDFKLKPWAERFLCLRAELYQSDTQNDSGEGTPPQNSTASPFVRLLYPPSTGFRNTG